MVVTLAQGKTWHRRLRYLRQPRVEKGEPTGLYFSAIVPTLFIDQ